MKKEYIKPNSEVICPSLQTYFEPASNGFTTTASDEEYNGEFAIQSMNPFVVDWFYKYRKNYIIGLVALNNLNYKLFKKCIKKIDFISINKKELPFKNKKIIIGWTIKTNKELEKYRPLADNLICENILDNFT